MTLRSAVANVRYRIVWQIESRFARHVRRRPLTALARRTLEGENVTAPSELCVAITDDTAIRELNRRYRDVDEPTDVLSFGAETNDGFITMPETVTHIGDIAISHETAARQARESNHDVGDEIAHLLVHGILHLLGYDHQAAAERRAMQRREDELLERAAH